MRNPTHQRLLTARLVESFGRLRRKAERAGWLDGAPHLWQVGPDLEPALRQLVRLGVLAAVPTLPYGRTRLRATGAAWPEGRPRPVLAVNLLRPEVRIGHRTPHPELEQRVAAYSVLAEKRLPLFGGGRPDGARTDRTKTHGSNAAAEAAHQRRARSGELADLGRAGLLDGAWFTAADAAAGVGRRLRLDVMTKFGWLARRRANANDWHYRALPAARDYLARRAELERHTRRAVAC